MSQMNADRLYDALMSIAAMRVDEHTDHAQLVALMKAIALAALKECKS